MPRPGRGHGWTRGRLSSSCRWRCAASASLATHATARDRPRLLRALGHEQEGVRLAALLALHKQARRGDNELFLPLLADRSWWVRQAAADSLATLPGASPDALQQLLEQVHDRYGRDALRRAIAEVRR
nr:DUF5691 domain-containing protein [Stutzerimonas stutzeri]